MTGDENVRRMRGVGLLLLARDAMRCESSFVCFPRWPLHPRVDCA